MLFAKNFALSVWVIFLAGCAISPERLAASPDIDVCRSYGIYKSGIGFSALAQQYRTEIMARKLMSQEDWEAADQQKIKRGMSLCALYASWGNPDKENRSVGVWGTHVQHVYRSGLRYVSAQYVYSENGRVTSWQD